MTTTLKKLTSIKNLGLFKNYNWESALPEFKRYNIIYGWNGTGKTTLSKLINSFNEGSNSEFPLLEYTIQDSVGNSYCKGSRFPTPIRVFNHDFINKHINFEQQSSEVIHFMLTENKGLLELIRADEIEKARLESLIKQKEKERAEKETAKSKTFSEIARTINQATFGVLVGSYNKTRAETVFLQLEKPAILSDSELEELSLSVSQNPMPIVSEIIYTSIFNNIAPATAKARELLSKTIITTVIARLKDNPDISEWVEQGILLQKKHNNDTCEFCSSRIPDGRLEQLATFFNDEDTKLKKDIDVLLEELRNVYGRIQSIKPVDKMNLYSELRDKYEKCIRSFESERKNLLSDIETLGNQIKEKKKRTTEAIEIIKSIPEVAGIVDTLNDINGILSVHNEKTNSFDSLRKEEAKRIERHFLSTITDDINKTEKAIHQLQSEIRILNNGSSQEPVILGLSAINLRIIENKVKMLSSSKACKELNENLTKFLGYSEISFTTNDDETGYLIKRGTEPAKNLSEGEKTAIAFVFFIVQLKDEGFDIENGIIVIDDPVSSLGSNSQFQAFSFLKTATKNAAQLILLTHNFEFLKLIMNWIVHSREPHALFMVKNRYPTRDGTREAFLDRLDKTLAAYATEYLYLFNLCYRYKSDGTIECAYHMPNIARKLLETFLMYSVPTTDTLYVQLQKLHCDEEKKTAVFKFVNNQSHFTGSGFDLSLVPEAQKCVEYLLDIMKESAEQHFKYLEESLTV